MLFSVLPTMRFAHLFAHNGVIKVSLAVDEIREIIAMNLDNQKLNKLILDDLGSY